MCTLQTSLKSLSIKLFVVATLVCSASNCTVDLFSVEDGGTTPGVDQKCSTQFSLDKLNSNTGPVSTMNTVSILGSGFGGGETACEVTKDGTNIMITQKTNTEIQFKLSPFSSPSIIPMKFTVNCHKATTMADQTCAQYLNVNYIYYYGQVTSTASDTFYGLIHPSLLIANVNQITDKEILIAKDDGDKLIRLYGDMYGHFEKTHEASSSAEGSVQSISMGYFDNNNISDYIVGTDMGMHIYFNGVTDEDVYSINGPATFMNDGQYIINHNGSTQTFHLYQRDPSSRRLGIYSAFGDQTDAIDQLSINNNFITASVKPELNTGLEVAQISAPISMPSFTSFGVDNLGSGQITLVADDFDGDENPDIAVSSMSGIEVFIKNLDGTYRSDPLYILYESKSANSFRRAMRTGDFNQDGFNDIVYVDPNILGKVFYLLSCGKPLIECPTSQAQSQDAPGTHYDIAVAFMNDDNIPDVIIPRYDPDKSAHSTDTSNGSVTIFTNQLH